MNVKSAIKDMLYKVKRYFQTPELKLENPGGVWRPMRAFAAVGKGT